MQALKFCYFMALEIYEIIVSCFPIDMGTDYSWISERVAYLPDLGPNFSTDDQSISSDQTVI